MGCDCTTRDQCRFAVVRETGGRLLDICRGVTASGEPVDERIRARYFRRWEDDPAPRPLRRRSSSPPRPRPGAELKKLIAGFGLKVRKSCGCDRRAAEMDLRGADWCDENVETIVGWLRENAPRLLGITVFSEIAARQLVRSAIARSRRVASTASWRSAFTSIPELPPRFIRTSDYVHDIETLIAKLPPNVSHVVGVARSGLFPASLIAMRLHLPLSVVQHQQLGIVPAGNGWRLDERSAARSGPVLVVDDTTMTGNSLRKTQGIVASQTTFPKGTDFLYAHVYVNPLAHTKPDLWAVDLGWPHLLEWNLFNSGMVSSIATDFDGVLCRDARPDEDDDGGRYREFLRTAEPLHLVRREKIPLVVTARLERYRPETEAWLSRWGVSVRNLVMHPASTLVERRSSEVAAWKADRLREFLATGGGIAPRMFVESCPRQAKRVAELTRQLVVCPTTGECFR